METTVNRIDSENIELSISIPTERVDKAFAKTYQKISNSQKIKGFRAGKVPKHVIDSAFGKEAVAGLTLEDLLQEAYVEACDKENIHPLGEPDFGELPSIAEGAPFEVKAKILVLPDFEVCDYSVIEADFTREPELPENAVEETLSGIRMRFADTAPLIEDRGAIATDTVVVDYKVTPIMPGGKELSASSRNNVTVVISEDAKDDTFEANLKGLKIGASKTFEIAASDDEEDGTARYEVVVKEIKKMVPLQNDEELLAKIGGAAKDMDDLRENIKRGITARIKNEHEERISRFAVDYVLNNSDVIIPEPLIEEEINVRLEKLEGYLAMNRSSLDAYLEQTGTTLEALKSEEHDSALRTIKTRILFNRIFSERGMVAHPREVEQYVTAYAMDNQINRAELKKLARDRDFVAMIRQKVREAKVMMFLRSRVKFTDDAEGPAPLEAVGEGKKDAPEADTVSEQKD